MFHKKIQPTNQKNVATLAIAFLLALSALPIGAVEDLSQASLLARVKADYIALRQAESELHTLGSDGAASAADIDEFQRHLARLREQLVEDCQALSGIDGESLPHDLPCPTNLTPRIGPAKIDIATEKSSTEEIAALDAELNLSLSAFDDRLLREQARVKGNRPMTDEPENRQLSSNEENDTQDGQSDTAQGASGESSEMEDPSESGEEIAQTGMAGSGAAAEEAEQEGERTTAANETEAGASNANTVASTAKSGHQGQNGQGQSGKDESGKSGAVPAHQTAGADTPEDIPDGSDDDIVARQLREAAEKETDPELKKRLWEEYRKYKRGA